MAWSGMGPEQQLAYHRLMSACSSIKASVQNFLFYGNVIRKVPERVFENLEILHTPRVGELCAMWEESAASAMRATRTPR